MKTPALLLALVLLFNLGCGKFSQSAGASNSVPSISGGGVDGGGTGVFVAGCSFSNLNQTFGSDIVVSSRGAPIAMIYDNGDRTTQIPVTATKVEIIPGAAGSSELETIQSVSDNGDTFKLVITQTQTSTNKIYLANLVHAALSNGTSLDNQALLCSIP